MRMIVVIEHKLSLRIGPFLFLRKERKQMKIFLFILIIVILIVGYLIGAGLISSTASSLILVVLGSLVSFTMNRM